MATHSIHTGYAYNKSESTHAGIFTKYLAYVDSQSGNAVAWWAVSLLVHGCFLVPLTFLFVYSSGGPATLFLTVSMACFFINFIGNMGGASFRFNFNSFMLSILIHALMVASTLVIVL
jgi:hypothetical protein